MDLSFDNLLRGWTIGDLCFTFKYPPNIFDDFILSRRQQVKAIVMVMLNSKSWHLTALSRWAVEPLRAIRSKLK